MMMSSSLGRRFFLTGSAACLATRLTAGIHGPNVSPALPPPHRHDSLLDRLIPSTPARLDLVHPHTGEQFTGRFYRNGYHYGTLHRLAWFCRDWREGISVPICVRLYWTLARLTADYQPKEPLVVLSAYRTPMTNSNLPGASPHSLHMEGRAVDIHLPGVSPRILALRCRELEVGGVGCYPGAGFVHIDSGRYRYWEG